MEKVLLWYKTFLKEGEGDYIAYRHAVQRAFEGDHLSESKFEELSNNYILFRPLLMKQMRNTASKGASK